MTYEFCTDLVDPTTGIMLVRDFECRVEVNACVDDGQLIASCRDVLIDGVSMKGMSTVSDAIRMLVLEAADADIDAAGPLWDLVAKDQGIFVHGAAGDPDAHFYQVA